MKKQLLIPPKLTNEETEKLNRYFWLPDWQFELLIERHCVEVSATTIDWKDDNYPKAIIYGLKAVYTKTKKECLANFFVHFGTKVYQSISIGQAVNIVDLIKKDFEFDEYEDKLFEQKCKAKELAQKKTNKTLVSQTRN